MNTARPRYARSDLDRLERMDRAALFEALGSFDAAGLTDAAFAVRMEPLLRPGLPAEGPWGRPPDDPAPEDAPPDIRALADDALEHRFTFYGETHALPARIDWDANPGTAHWGHDLNRFTFLDPLVRAFRATRDPRYARKAVGLVMAWIADCDFARAFAGGGYAFGSYLNQAIHLGAWANGMARLEAEGMLTPAERLRLVKSFQEHLAYLEIVTRGHHGNWPTIGCMGMLAALERYPVLRETDRFAEHARTCLAEQIAEQVLPDGVQDELTPHYHQVVVSNLCRAMRSLRALGKELDPRTRETLRAMVRYSQRTVMPDGSRQLAFNDSDPASVPDLEKLLAPLGLAGDLLPPSELGPCAYPYAGVAFLRQRATEGDLYLAFDAGPFGRAHQHEDKLGFWLFACGRNFLVDPGRHLYDRSAASYRAHLASTRAHSTILVDGHGQNSAARRETWIATEPVDLGWREAPGEVRARGAYDLGYGPDAIPVVHRREIVLVRDRFWILFDAVSGAGRHRIESRFQFAPGPLRWREDRAQTAFPDANLLLWPRSDTPFAAALEEGSENPRGGWYSNSYNRIEPAPALVLTAELDRSLRMAVLLLPFRGSVPPACAWSFDGRTAEVRLDGAEPVRIETRL